MSTCHETITEALNELGIIGEGEEPTPAALANAMPVLQSLYDGMVSSGTFGRATDVEVDDAYTASEGDRVFASASETISLPISLRDPITNVMRPPRDYSLVRIAGSQTQTYIFISPLGAWKRMTSLVLADYAPLCERDFHGLACVLALRLQGRFKATALQTTTVVAARFLSTLALKFDAPRVTVRTDYF